MRPPEEATKHDMMAHRNALQAGRIRKGKPANRPLGYHTVIFLSRPFFMDHQVRLTFPESSGGMRTAWIGRCRIARPGDQRGRGPIKERAKSVFPSGVVVVMIRREPVTAPGQVHTYSRLRASSGS